MREKTSTVRRALLCNSFLILISLVAPLSATVYKGTSSLYYTNKNIVFHNNDSAVGEVLLKGGFTILSDATGTFSIGTPVYGAIDLHTTGTLRLGTDLILDATVTFSRGGNIWGNGHAIFLTGNMCLPDNSVFTFINNTIIDGQGHDLILGKYSQLLVDGGITVTFKNMTIKNTLNIASCPPIRCMDWYSKACFDNVAFSFNDDCAVRNGQVFIHNDVDFTGTSKFSYRSVRPSYIAQHSNLIFDPNTIFEFYPSTADNTLIQMTDKTSALVFDDSTLLTTHTGIRLTCGSLYFDNKVTLSSVDVTALNNVEYKSAGISDFILSKWSPDGRYVAACNWGTSYLIYKFNEASAALVQITSGVLWYAFQIVWSPDGKYILTTRDITDIILHRFEDEKVTTIKSFTGTTNPSHIALSPNGKYLAFGVNNGQSRLYRFDAEQLPLLQTLTITDSTATVDWHPSGRYLALGNYGHRNRIYRLDGNTLSLVYSTTDKDGNPRIKWSPDGNYLFATGGSISNKLYRFNSAQENLTCVQYLAAYGSTQPSWSPDGHYLILGNNAGTRMYVLVGGKLQFLCNVSSSYGYQSDWRPGDGKYITIDSGRYGGAAVMLYKVNYAYDTSPLGFNNGITFGNSALGSAYDLDVYSLADACVDVYGKLWHDSLSSWAFDSRDSYLSLNRYDSKFKVTNDASINNWKKQHIIKSSEDNLLFLQDNQVWGASSDFLAPEETFEFMNDLIIPDNQIVQLSSNAVIDGQGHDLILGKYSQLLVDGGITVTFKNMTIKNTLNTISSPPIRCMDWYSKACLDNVTLSFNDDFAFRNGQMFVHNDVDVTGTSKFSYRSVRPSYIAQHSNLIFDPNTTFEFYPSTTDNTLIQMADKTSAIIFDDSTLLTTHTGIRLIKGNVFFDNKVTLSSANNTAFVSLIQKDSESFGNAAYAASWSQNQKYLAVGGWDSPTNLIIYGWNGSTLSPTGITKAAGTTVDSVEWSPDGKYLAICGQNPYNDVIIYQWDGLSLTVTTSKYFGGYALSVNWSPDGKFLAVGGNYAYNDIIIYQWNGLSLTVTTSKSFGTYARSVNWSPDGKYLAACGDNGSTDVIVYEWDGSILTPKDTESFGTAANALNWSPDGKYLAVGGNNNYNDLIVYQWNGASLTVTTSQSFGPYVLSVKWSPDGKYLAAGGSNGSKDAIVYEWDGSILIEKYIIDFSTQVFLAKWSQDGKYFIAGGSNDSDDVIVYEVSYKFDTSLQSFRNSIVFGDSTLSYTNDLAVHALADARINLYGKLWHDSLNSWIFDSRDSYLSLNRYDSKFKITSADSMNNWKKQHIIKSSEENTIFLQDNQVWETSTDYNLAPEETFEFMNDLIIPDNQQVKFSSNAVIDGQGHNLILGEYAQLLVDGGITVTLKNMTIQNTHNTISCPPIRCMDWYSKVCLDNVTLSFNDDFAFRNGQMFIHNDIVVTGTSKFSYRSVCPSYIAQHSNLIFDPNTTFEFYPSATDNALIQMADKTSGLIFDDSTLLTTHTGMRLTKGSVYFDNRVTLSSMDNTYLVNLGTPIVQAEGSTVWDAEWSPDGKYLVEGNGSTGKIYSFNGSVFTSITNISFGVTVWATAWSPDGKHVAFGTHTGAALPHTQVEVYAFDGTSLTITASAFCGARVNTLGWSPNGKYVAVGTENTHGLNTLKIYSFNQNSLNLIYQTPFFTNRGVYYLSWRPDGKYLAVGEWNGSFGIFSFNGTSLSFISTGPSDFNDVNGLSWSPDGNHLAMSLYDPSSPLQSHRIYYFNGSSLSLKAYTHLGGGRRIQWHPGGQYLASDTSEGYVYILKFTGSSIDTIQSISYGTDMWPVGWRSDGNFLCIGGLTNNLYAYPVNYQYDTSPQGFINSIVFGNSTLGSAYDLDVNVLAGARVNVFGNFMYDNVN